MSDLVHFQSFFSFHADIQIYLLEHVMHEQLVLFLYLTSAFEYGFYQYFFPFPRQEHQFPVTTIPLAGPPTEGLHGIKATISKLMVIINVFAPIRAAARPASQPA